MNKWIEEIFRDQRTMLNSNFNEKFTQSFAQKKIIVQKSKSVKMDFKFIVRVLKAGLQRFFVQTIFRWSFSDYNELATKAKTQIHIFRYQFIQIKISKNYAELPCIQI